MAVNLPWPDTFPQHFVSGEHSEKPLPITEMNDKIYPPVVRQVRMGTLWAVTGSVIMTDIQYEQFKVWYVETVRGMLYRFDARFLGPPAVYRFRDDPEATAEPAGYWKVQLSLLREG